MNIFLDHTHAGELPTSEPGKGAFFNRLVAIDVFHRKGMELTYEPVYRPLINVVKIGNIVIVNFFPKKHAYTFVLTPSWPFVQVENWDSVDKWREDE